MEPHTERLDPHIKYLGFEGPVGLFGASRYVIYNLRSPFPEQTE